MHSLRDVPTGAAHAPPAISASTHIEQKEYFAVPRRGFNPWENFDWAEELERLRRAKNSRRRW